MKDDSEIIWRKQQEEYGWKLPPPAHWFWRLPVIRRVRYAWLTMKAEEHTAAWSSVGIGFGGVGAYDRWVLYAIFRGWC